jgi:hypothetical protein
MQMTSMVTKIPARQEDDEFFESRQDAATMEEAIGKFMDGMEAQERGGFKELHSLLARLPVPTVKASQAMTHKDALEGGFLPYPIHRHACLSGWSTFTGRHIRSCVGCPPSWPSG